jgi:hypothetical protein
MTSGIIVQVYCAEDEIRIVLASIVAKSVSKKIKSRRILFEQVIKHTYGDCAVSEKGHCLAR